LQSDFALESNKDRRYNLMQQTDAEAAADQIAAFARLEVRVRACACVNNGSPKWV
jgi:hypothetical protein